MYYKGMTNDLPTEANDRGSKYTKDEFNLDLTCNYSTFSYPIDCLTFPTYSC